MPENEAFCGWANGVKDGTGKEGDTGKDAGDHGPYMEFQVEKPVEKISGDAPEYPSSLKIVQMPFQFHLKK